MAKNDKQETRYGAPADSLASDAYPASTTEPDAKHYVIRPTSEPIDPALGEVPEGRFLEQVLKSEGSGEEAHPEENRPALGVTGEDDDQ